jgi:hypothetical protein
VQAQVIPVGIDVSQDPVGTTVMHHLVSGIPRDLLGTGVPEGDAAVGIDEVDTVIDGFEDGQVEVVLHDRSFRCCQSIRHPPMSVFVMTPPGLD